MLRTTLTTYATLPAFICFNLGILRVNLAVFFTSVQQVGGALSPVFFRQPCHSPSASDVTSFHTLRSNRLFLFIHHSCYPSLPHSFTAGLKRTYFTNPSQRRLSFYSRGLPSRKNNKELEIENKPTSTALQETCRRVDQ